VAHAGGAPYLGPPVGQLKRMQRVAAMARSPGPPWGTGPLGRVWGRAPARIVGPRRQRTAESTSAGLGTSRHTDVATSRPVRAGALDVL
jgi:hypothetical protein